MDPDMSSVEKLLLLSYCGVKIDTDGQVSDWQDKPASGARPFGSSSRLHARVGRQVFSAQDDDIVRRWCSLAERERVQATQAFEQLEVVVGRSSANTHPHFC